MISIVKLYIRITSKMFFNLELYLQSSLKAFYNVVYYYLDNITKNIKSINIFF